MKYFNYFFVLVFIVFAGLQYNDPDPYLWIPIYLYPAVLCFMATKYSFSRRAYFVGFIIFSIYALYKLFDENGVIDWISKHQTENIAGTMKAEAPWIEETREFFGLLIILIVMFINFRYLTKLTLQKKSANTNS